MQKPYQQIQLISDKDFRSVVKSENWELLDRMIYQELGFDGSLRGVLSSFIKIKKLEHIISIREHPDEDGIWHDDGSRELAFTLSLTIDQVDGGVLEMRNKNNHQEIYRIQTPSFGVLTVFKTGVSGYEHRVLRVNKGKRIIIAGWVN